MRINISAQSAASTPPASERIVISASRSSYSPLSRVWTSSARISSPTESSSLPASSIALVSFSSCANSKSSGTSSSRRRIPVTLLIVDWTRESLLVTTWAFSGSSQRLGTLASASSLVNSSVSFGTSITCSIALKITRSLFTSSA